MLSCALLVCESGRTFAFFDSFSRSLVLFENDKIVAYDVPVFTDVGNGRIEQVDSFVVSGSEVNPNYSQIENLLPDLVSMNENPRIASSMISDSNTIISSSDPIRKDVDQSNSGKNKDNSSSGSKNGLDANNKVKDMSNEKKNDMDKTKSEKKNEKVSNSNRRTDNEDENCATCSLVWMAVVFVLPCLFI
jgi:hypothetical protein